MRPATTPRIVGAESTSLFLRYQKASGQWTQTGAIRSKKGNIQPAVVEVSPGRLIAYSRRGGGYGPTTDGWMVRAESTDGGWTWSEGRDSTFQNPNAAVDFLKLASGNLLLVFNDSMTSERRSSPRFRLTAMRPTHAAGTSPKVREISRTRLSSRAPTAASTPSTRRTGGRRSTTRCSPSHGCSAVQHVDGGVK